jgi:site-specific DNA-methyltransferase (adenine-specific)
MLRDDLRWEVDLKTRKMQLYNEDCINGMVEHLRPGSIDVVMTSPPYNIGVKYRGYDDTIPRDRYLNWIASWGIAVKRVLKDSGSVFLNVGSKPTSPEVPFQVFGALSGDFVLQNVIHWIKSIYIESESYGSTVDINVGHYKPVNSKRFINDNHEYVFHLTKSGQIKLDRLSLGIPYKDVTNINRWKAGSHKLRCRGNVWFIPYKTIRNRSTDRPHPASFPSRLAENCIKLHGVTGNMTVLDPFMGLGNTGQACRQLHVAFIGFEIDPYYYKKAVQRLSRSEEK